MMDSLHDLEAKLASMGYTMEQATKAIKEVVEVLEQVAEVAQEAIKSAWEILMEIFEEAVPKLKEWAEQVKYIFDEESPSTKYIPLDKRLQYVNQRRIANRLVKEFCGVNHKESNVWFTRYRKRC